MIYTLAALAMLVRSGHSASDSYARPANASEKYTAAFVWYPPAMRPPQGAPYGYNEDPERKDYFRFNVAPTEPLKVEVSPGVWRVKTTKLRNLYDCDTAKGRNACYEECWGGKGFLILKDFSKMTNGKYRRMADYKSARQALFVDGNGQSNNGNAQASGYREGICIPHHGNRKDGHTAYYGKYGMYGAEVFGKFREYYRNDTICPIAKTQTISIIYKKGEDKSWHYFKIVRECNLDKYVYNPRGKRIPLKYGYEMEIPAHAENGNDRLNVIMPHELGVNPSHYDEYGRGPKGEIFDEPALETMPLSYGDAQKLERKNDWYSTVFISPERYNSAQKHRLQVAQKQAPAQPRKTDVRKQDEPKKVPQLKKDRMASLGAQIAAAAKAGNIPLITQLTAQINAIAASES